MSKSGPSAAPNGGMSAPNAVPPAYPSLPVEPPPPYTPHASATPIYNPGYPQQPPPQFPQFGGAHPSQPTINGKYTVLFANDVVVVIRFTLYINR